MTTHPHTAVRSCSPSRAGNAMVIAVGILTIAGAALAVSTNRAVSTLRTVSGQQTDSAALGAVEAVIAKHQQVVIRMAEGGDPNAFASWGQNYGVEFFGNCEVRWMVEPVRSPSKDKDGNPLPFISNPSPDINWEAPDTGIKDAVGAAYPDTAGVKNWITNDSVYLFRVSAEARQLDPSVLAVDQADWSKPGTWRSRAQGVRYVSVNKEPLFRYVIFYAQNGPKGDLELSHGPSINIQGNVHSNGSIYLGAGAKANAWDAVRPRDEANPDPGSGETRLGPDNWTSGVAYAIDDRILYNSRSYSAIVAHTAGAAFEAAKWLEIKDAHIRVTGVNGLFRLAKPAMYGRFNQFPMAAPKLLPAWAETPPSGAVDASEYDISVATPLDAFDASPRPDIDTATFLGDWVNPYRIKRDSQLVTRPLGTGTLPDTSRRINGNPIVGNWEDVDSRGNDSRDLQRLSPDRSWSTLSKNIPPDGFSGFARTQVTGGRAKQLPETLASRPLETQKLLYPDLYVLNKITKATSVTATELANPAIGPLLSGLAVGDIPSKTTPVLQPFLNANRERGDAHDLASPVFLNTATAPASETVNYAEVAGLANILEVPGQYVRYAIDGTGSTDAYMKRVIDTATPPGSNQGFIGWQITDETGTPLAQPGISGIIIRERPVPDFRYWGITSTGTLFSDRSFGANNWMPYAYGKHKDPGVWPYTEMYVSNQGKTFTTPAPNPPAGTSYAVAPTTAGTGAFNTFVRTSSAKLDPSKSRQSYAVDPADPAHITITAAASRGDPSTWGFASKTVKADSYGLFRDNWRLIHLKRANITDAVIPSANMTAASTYFKGSEFTAVQARLIADSTGALILNGQNNQALAGLMIRPVDTAGPGVSAADANLNLTTNALNSRNPYAALLVSAERGIVVQRRMAPSKLIMAVAPVSKRFYTGTNDGGGGTNALIGCTTPEQAVFRQVNRTPVTAPGWAGTVSSYDSGIVRTPATGYTAGTSTPSYSTFSVTLSKPQGEGTVSATFTIAKGPYTVTKNWSANKVWTKGKYRQYLTPGLPGYWDLQVYKGGTVLTNYQTSMIGAPAAATFPSGWLNKNFWLNPTWASGYSANPSASTWNSTIPTYAAYVSTASPGQGFIAADTLRFSTKWYNPNYGNTTAINPPKVAVAGSYLYGENTNTKSLSPSTTTWTSTQTATSAFTDLNQWAAASTFIGGDANLLSSLAGYGITSASALGVVGTPPDPTVDVVDPAAPAMPGDPAIPTQPNVPTYAGDLRFAIDRDGAAAYMQPIEVNSWLSARGTWSAAGFPTTTGFTRYQDTATTTVDKITSSGTDAGYLPTIDPGTSESLRPDYWTGAPFAASWLGMYAPTNATNGSIVPSTSGYLAPAPNYLNNGLGANALWEDAQIPYWVNATAQYKKEVTGTTRASVVLYNKKFYQCIQDHVAANAIKPGTVGGLAHWTEANQIWLRIEKNAGNQLVFKYSVGLTAPSGPADWRWREVAAGIDPATGTIQRSADYMILDPSPTNPSAAITIPTAPAFPAGSVWPDTWVLGPCLQSGSPTTAATVQFGDIAVATTAAAPNDVIDHEDWEGTVDTVYYPLSVGSLAGRTVDITTKYLCSQYQVFFGPLDITEDYFSYTVGNTGLATARIADERIFYNPREFWSQSASWNEGDLTAAWTPVSYPWVWKETGTTVQGALPGSGSTATSQVEFFARTTALDINMGNLQSYLKTRTLAEAAYKWITNASQGVTSGDLLKDRFSGLLYAARTNRYPRNPIPSGPNPFNPDLPNQTANASAGANLSLTDLFANQPAGVPTDRHLVVRDRLAATDVSNRGKLSAPIRMQEFTHGIMISNGATIDWGMGSPKVFGQSKTSIVTPNQLYILGDLNNNKQSVRTVASDPGSATLKYTPLAIMGDNVTLLSNSWTVLNYSRPGLATGTDKVTLNTSTLSQQYGTTAAAATSYRTCILTNNQPTTKYRVFQGEGAPFINTMLFVENWSGKIMNFTGSLVVLDSCRYSRAFLLDDPRDYGRSPFGLMGWHTNAAWSTLTGWAGGTPEWCKNGSNQALPLAGGTNDVNSPYGSIQVYKAPTRNMTFNLDLLTEPGTPPNTPFGVTAAGVAGWTRVLR